jgi:hypothetical protein
MMPKLPEPDCNAYEPKLGQSEDYWRASSVRAIQEEAYKAGMAAAVPDGWKVVPVVPTKAMVVQGAGMIDDNGGNARWSDMREAWEAMLSASPEVK